MPVYEYVCKSCSRTFEELMFPGDPLPACPVCASADAERVLSAFAVGHAEGSGPAACGVPRATSGCGGCCGGGACGLN